MEEWLEFLRVGAAEVTAASKNYCEIPLRNMQKEVVGWAKCSPEDYEELMKYKWSKTNDGYAQSEIKKRTWRMHRIVKEILSKEIIPQGHIIDHKNGDKLDNTRNNLRFATQLQNAKNTLKRKNTTSIYRNVSKTKYGTYKSTVEVNGKCIHLGTTKTEEEAAMMYDCWCIQQDDFEEGFRRLNFPDKIEFYKQNLTSILKNKSRKKSSIYFGVFKPAKQQKFEARIMQNKTLHYILVLSSEIECANAYDEFVYKNQINLPLNFPEKYPNHLKDYLLPIKTGKRVREDGLIELVRKNQKLEDPVIIIDADDYDKVKNHTVMFHGKGYARVKMRQKSKLLHRLVMDITDPAIIIDHIDRNGLNCSKKNLRVATPSQNAKNRSKQKRDSSSVYLGVSHIKTSSISPYRLHVRLGHASCSKLFKTEIDAARYRDLFILKHAPNDGYSLNFTWTPLDIEEWKAKLNF